MRLYIDPLRGSCRTVSNEVRLETHQPLDKDHRFIVRPIDNSGRTPKIGLIIEIKPMRGKKPVQRATVKFLGTISELYMVDLDPSQPIFPMASAIEALLGRKDIEESMIVPMFTSGHYDAPPVRRGMRMVSDGAIESTSFLEEGHLPSVSHRVDGATWAISHSKKGGVHNVFLWNDITNQGKLAELTAALDRIGGRTVIS